MLPKFLHKLFNQNDYATNLKSKNSKKKTDDKTVNVGHVGNVPVADVEVDDLLDLLNLARALLGRLPLGLLLLLHGPLDPLHVLQLPNHIPPLKQGTSPSISHLRHTAFVIVQRLGFLNYFLSGNKQNT